MKTAQITLQMQKNQAKTRRGTKKNNEKLTQIRNRWKRIKTRNNKDLCMQQNSTLDRALVQLMDCIHVREERALVLLIETNGSANQQEAMAVLLLQQNGSDITQCKQQISQQYNYIPFSFLGHFSSLFFF